MHDQHRSPTAFFFPRGHHGDPPRRPGLALTVVPPSIGPSALAAAVSCSSTTPVADRPVLRIGDTGSCVRVLQQSLINRGYSVGSSGADGIFGNATYLAVRRFQADYVGVSIDGIVGPQTWRTLVSGGARYPRSTGPNRTGRVVLSFDDCPASLAAFQSAVAGAERLGIALVLFPTGQCLQSGRFSPSYARSHGAYVFNHTISHPTSRPSVTPESSTSSALRAS